MMAQIQTIVLLHGHKNNNYICLIKYKFVKKEILFCKYLFFLYLYNFKILKKMNTDNIKGRLHESIENIDNHEFLMTIKELIEHKYQPIDSPKLTEWQLKRIKESEEQIENGEFLTDEQIDKIIDKWLE